MNDTDPKTKKVSETPVTLPGDAREIRNSLIPPPPSNGLPTVLLASVAVFALLLSLGAGALAYTGLNPTPSDEALAQTAAAGDATALAFSRLQSDLTAVGRKAAALEAKITNMKTPTPFDMQTLETDLETLVFERTAIAAQVHNIEQQVGVLQLEVESLRTDEPASATEEVATEEAVETEDPALTDETTPEVPSETVEINPDATEDVQRVEVKVIPDNQGRMTATIRSGPGTGYSRVATVNVNVVLEALDAVTGFDTTFKNWIRVRLKAADGTELQGVEYEENAEVGYIWSERVENGQAVFNQLPTTDPSIILPTPTPRTSLSPTQQPESQETQESIPGQ
jgi:hypothetical protein